MATTLSSDLQRALREGGDEPVELVDPETKQVYLLIARDRYDRLRSAIVGEMLTLDEQRQLLRQAGTRAGWNDTEMDAYDRYDELHADKP